MAPAPSWMYMQEEAKRPVIRIRLKQPVIQHPRPKLHLAKHQLPPILSKMQPRTIPLCTGQMATIPFYLFSKTCWNQMEW